ncbi:2-5A-dependent ribonuclease isoform X2 [Lepus europaeus]|uniref:2-5A-dependent ribonuclease isoform X2 n=1 Tax=Lepus europaeus TaxID=9983 RepID=UPI002B46353F|nr:2-5A-dependent ribonuclease isoform X2 [Lepus europaeus]
MDTQDPHSPQDGPRPPGSGGGAEADGRSLMAAVAAEDVARIRELLGRGAHVNFQEPEWGWSPLHSAVQRDRPDIVELLLQHGADPGLRKRNGATPLIVAGLEGNVRVLQMLLERGAAVDERDAHGFTALMEAAGRGHVEALRFLHERGARVNLARETTREQQALRKGGATALMDAAENGRVEAARALLELGADVGARDNMGRSALTHALLSCPAERAEATIHLLLRHGADANGQDAEGKTALILAVERRHLGAVRALLEQERLNVDERDSEGRTALLVATQLGLGEVARLLCRSGARVDCGDLVLAARRNYDNDLARFFLSLGAPERPQAPAQDWRPQSQRWGPALSRLHRMNRPMIGKLKIFLDQDYRIAPTSEGGLYLGLYEAQEVAVKVFALGSARARQEVSCLQNGRPSSHLLTLYGCENDRGRLYVCVALCEWTLEEYLHAHWQEAVEDQEDVRARRVLATLLAAVRELHESWGYAHGDLQPQNILVDTRGDVRLADFDQSVQLAGAAPEVRQDLEALGRLVLYVVQNGDVPFVELTAKPPAEVVHRCPDEESKDLARQLLCPGDDVGDRLGRLLGHPFFWPWQDRFRTLRNVGNESDIKRRKRGSQLLQLLRPGLSEHRTSFARWTQKIHGDVMRDMNAFYKDSNSYKNTVGDLLKFIRNVGEHINEDKNRRMKAQIGDPACYFQKTFPDLLMYVYRKLRDTEYRKHFPQLAPHTGLCVAELAGPADRAPSAGP